MINILLALLAVAQPYNDDLPPVQYQGNAKPTVIVTVDNPNSDAACGKAQPGWIIEGCEFDHKGVPIIMVPNPCTYPEALSEDSYAHLMCHEFGHVNGWNTTHNN